MSSFHFETQQNFDLKQQNFDFKQKHLPAPASPQPHYVILYRHEDVFTSTVNYNPVSFRKYY